MEGRCDLEADERISVLFEEAVLEVTRGSLIRDDFESAKRAVKAASGASFSTKAKSAEWIGSKGWPSEEEFNALMKKVAYKVGLRTKVEAAKQRPSGDPSPAPATIDRLEIDYLNVAVGLQAVVCCQTRLGGYCKGQWQIDCLIPGWQITLQDVHGTDFSAGSWSALLAMVVGATYKFLLGCLLSMGF